MKESENNIYDNMSLEEAKALINDPTISDDDIRLIIKNLKDLCNIFGTIYEREKFAKNKKDNRHITRCVA